jgi:hypothetical protein
MKKEKPHMYSEIETQKCVCTVNYLYCGGSRFGVSVMHDKSHDHSNNNSHSQYH